MKIAVCIHLYHTNMWEEITSYLNNLKIDYDLYVNLPIKESQFGNNLPADFLWFDYLRLNPDLKPNGVKTEPLAISHYLKHGVKEKRKYTNKISIEERIKKFKSNSKIISSPNKGVDIGGFLYTYKHIDPKTDLILKIHTKAGLGSYKSPSKAVKNRGVESALRSGNNWFQLLMKGVLENEIKVNNIINEFQKNPKCGMVGNKLVNFYNPNMGEINKIYKIMGLNKFDPSYKFVGGTIFWVDNKIFKKYFTEETIDKLLNHLPEGYVIEPSPNHAMERIFGILVNLENKEVKSM